jgi:peptidoglycan/LPS O-acetylase OafA/YrhL
MPLALVVAVVAAGYLLPIESVVWNFYTNPILLEFACGIVLCVVYRRYTDAFARASPFLVALLILVLAVKLAFPGVQSLWAGAIPAVIVVAAALSIRVAKTPFSSFLILLGDASYSLYLSHPYVLQLWVKVSPENLSMPVQVIMGFIVCLAAVVVSVALYRLLELPSQRILLGRGRQRLAPTLIAGR